MFRELNEGDGSMLSDSWQESLRTQHYYKDFLKKVDNSEQIMLKKLDTIGQNSASSNGLPTARAYELFWPQGVVLRKFTFNKIFFRKKNSTETNMGVTKHKGY